MKGYHFSIRKIFVRAAVLVLFFSLIPFLAPRVLADDPPPGQDVMERTNVLAGARPDGANGDARFSFHANDLSRETAEAIQARVQANVARLQSQGALPREFLSQHVLLAWPLKLLNLKAPGYYGISNFIDEDPAFPNHVLDYNGGKRTYDTTSGYNHSGTDIFLWPFSWNKMDAKQVAVLAAANGTLTDKDDGNYDRVCSSNSPDTPNYVILTHDDGSRTWYLHIKKGTVTSKQIGAKVTAGEVLGYVGSSGISTGPHLHFEVRDSANKVIDPWVGPSNPTTTDSWWKSQKPYYDSAINQLTTGNAEPVLGACANETTNQQHVFSPGANVYFTTYYRDQLPNQESQYTILRPDNSVYSNWSFSSPNYYTASFWDWWFAFPADEALGVWTFRVQFNNKTYDQKFEFCTAKPSAPTLKSPANGGQSSANAKLKWKAASCANTYNLFVKDAATGKTVTKAKGLAADILQYQTKTLVAGKTYNWYVEAVNSFGKTKSAQRTFTVR